VANSTSNAEQIQIQLVLRDRRKLFKVSALHRQNAERTTKPEQLYVVTPALCYTLHVCKQISLVHTAFHVSGICSVIGDQLPFSDGF